MPKKNRVVKVEFINDPWEEGRFVITRKISGSRTYMVHAHEHWLRRWIRVWTIIERFEEQPAKASQTYAEAYEQALEVLRPHVDVVKQATPSWIWFLLSIVTRTLTVWQRIRRRLT